MAEQDTPLKSPRDAASDEPASPERRRFLSQATVALGACAGGLVAFPVVSAVVAPLGRRTVAASSSPVDVGAEADFVVNQPKHVVIRGAVADAWELSEVELGAAWVTRHEGGTWTAFSSVCPHLGCAVDYVGAGAEPYFCPCHSSSFKVDGAPGKGPSPRGLDSLPVIVANGRVAVEYHRYVLNKPTKVES